jgi:hypothetical protein
VLAVGSLRSAAARDRRLADFQRWSAAKLDGIDGPGQRQLLEHFLRWRLLRQVWSGITAARPQGHGPYQRAKQRIIRNVDVPVISTEGMEVSPPGPEARLAAIWRLLDETLAPGDRLAGCLVTLYGQQPSSIAALGTTDTCCVDGAARVKLGADWLDVPESVAACCVNTCATAATRPRLPTRPRRGCFPAVRRRTSQLPSARLRSSPA